jgi:chorismate mutase
MWSEIFRLGLTVVLCLTISGRATAQIGGGHPPTVQADKPVKPTGPAAKKADDLIRSYTARIEKEIAQGQKEIERLRGELHELIDVRDDMAKAIVDVRADLASKGTYSADLAIIGQPALAPVGTVGGSYGPAGAISFHRDLVYGLGTALPTNPSPQEREQLRRLAPRAELNRMIDRLRTEVEETRAEVDELAYKLLELRAGIPVSSQGTGGGMGGSTNVWFGSMGTQGGMM